MKSNHIKDFQSQYVLIVSTLVENYDYFSAKFQLFIDRLPN